LHLIHDGDLRDADTTAVLGAIPFPALMDPPAAGRFAMRAEVPLSVEACAPRRSLFWIAGDKNLCGGPAGRHYEIINRLAGLPVSACNRSQLTKRYSVLLRKHAGILGCDSK
jgi:hypothetical protein